MLSSSANNQLLAFNMVKRFVLWTSGTEACNLQPRVKPPSADSLLELPHVWTTVIALPLCVFFHGRKTEDERISVGCEAEFDRLGPFLPFLPNCKVRRQNTSEAGLFVSALLARSIIW